MENREFIPKRLEFDKTEGWYESGRIPYAVYYMFNFSTSDSMNLDEKNPARYKITPNLGGGESLSIFIHKSVPEEFKEIVLFHELIEAELLFADNISLDQAHQEAREQSNKYARTYLSLEELTKYLEWEKTLNFA